MEKEFVTYEQALKLKELGFDEKCLAFYNGKFLDSTEYDFDSCVSKDIGYCVAAPLKQQVFRWFRDVWGHNLLDEYDTWKQAESYCIDDLIQIITTGNNI